jgi:hypothetical protein
MVGPDQVGWRVMGMGLMLMDSDSMNCYYVFDAVLPSSNKPYLKAYLYLSLRQPAQGGFGPSEGPLTR